MDVFVHISEIDFFNLPNYLPWDFLIHISAHPPSFILFSLREAFRDFFGRVQHFLSAFLQVFFYRFRIESQESEHSPVYFHIVILFICDQCIRKNLLAIAAGADFIIDNDHVHSIIIKATHTVIRISHCLPEDIVRICS